MSNLTGPEITMLGDLIESNGRSVRENNAGVSHAYDLGTVVEVDVEIDQPGHGKKSTEITLKGTCRLIVVGHIRDCDMTPLYILSDLPVRYPLDDLTFSQPKLVYRYLATLIESGYGEDSLRPTGGRVLLKDTVQQWLGVED
jgi:hypothetical protein